MTRSVTRLLAVALDVWPSMILTCAVLLVASAHMAQAGTAVWTSHGPYGGRVFALAIDPTTTPSTLYAGADRGVFQSTDSGASWSPVNAIAPSDGYDRARVNVLAIDTSTRPSTLYAGLNSSTGVDGVVKSTDSGASWSAVNTGLIVPEGYALQVFALVIDPTTPSTLYAGSYYLGVFQSTDSGSSWSAVNTGLSGRALFVLALAINPTNPVPSTSSEMARRRSSVYVLPSAELRPR